MSSSMLGTVKLTSNPSSIEYVVTDFKLRKNSIAEMIKAFMTDKLKLSNKEDFNDPETFSASIQECIDDFNRLTMINITKDRFPRYNDIESNSSFNISLRPFKNFPVRIPEALKEFGLYGIWWILHFESLMDMSMGQICDIIGALNVLRDHFVNRLNHVNVKKQFPDEMYNYFITIVEKSERSIEITVT